MAELLSFSEGIVPISRDVRNVDDHSLEEGAGSRRPAIRRHWDRANEIHELVGKTKAFGAVELVASLTGNGRLVGVAQPGRGRDQCLQDGTQIEGRSADDLQDIRRRNLLLQRLPKFLEQAVIFDGDNRLL